MGVLKTANEAVTKDERRVRDAGSKWQREDSSSQTGVGELRIIRIMNQEERVRTAPLFDRLQGRAGLFVIRRSSGERASSSHCIEAVREPGPKLQPELFRRGHGAGV